MPASRDTWQAWAAGIALLLAVVFPVLSSEEGTRFLLGTGAASIIVAALLGLGAALVIVPRGRLVTVAVLFVAAHAGGWLAISLLPEVGGHTGLGFWGLVLASWLLGWALVVKLSKVAGTPSPAGRISRMLVPVLFGAWLLILWEVVVRGFAVPPIILPSPSAIGAIFSVESRQAELWADFQQTFLRAVLAGYAIGCLAGFAVALAADRVDFLRRGLLPIGNLVSALPIIGIAPIMVMWFGFDWPSKAAVVAVMTFFPMMVNTVAGLSATDAMHRDLMVTYAADRRQTVTKLKLPSALPFIFNALKINSTLALIGAIVAEFFGTPMFGMGFRISTEIGRLAVDVVWAEIAVAALAGSAFYGFMALLERWVTFWHPSFRAQ